MKRAPHGFTSIPTDLAARAVLNCLSSRRQRRLRLQLAEHWLPDLGPMSPDLMPNLMEESESA
ncbi:hypothetical protein [Synechococcus sp. MIT S1220]|uniref:hypothetical protein n=1 Tax=Synechococcus sp. MIT S1220 TaxID=3082549 RepID=UPI0039AE9B72